MDNDDDDSIYDNIYDDDGYDGWGIKEWESSHNS